MFDVPSDETAHTLIVFLNRSDRLFRWEDAKAEAPRGNLMPEKRSAALSFSPQVAWGTSELERPTQRI